MRNGRWYLLRGYGPVVAVATAFLAVSALTVPARRLQLTVGAADSGAAGQNATAAGAAPVATGSAASGALTEAAGPATTRPTGPAARRRVVRPGQAGGSADEAAGSGEPLGAVTPCSDRTRQIPKDPYSPP
ncbi:MAG: hypothetical protein LC792_03825, partial [Actinobacteria bacterium]|nr:hypothetical protein [Actinomycetota bacterium]